MAVMLLRTFVSILVLLAAPLSAQFRAGAAKSDITPDLAKAKAYLAGFANGRAATGVHDRLHARCLALSAGAKPVVLCGVDSIGLFHDDVLRVRKLVPEAAVIVAATHVHEAPDTMGLWGPQMGVSGIDEDYNALVVERTAEAARAALKAMRPASTSIARGVRSSWKQYFDDGRPPVVLDDELHVLAFTGRDGKRIATIVNWASHPEALGSRNTEITADWPSFLYDEIESKAGGVAVYINGAIGGMMSPLGATFNDPATGQPPARDTFRFAEVVGRAIGAAALEMNAGAVAFTPQAIEYRETLVDVPTTNKNFLMASAAGVFKGRKPMREGQGTQAPVGLLSVRAGGITLVEIACIPGELYPELSVGAITRDPNADFPQAPDEPSIKGEILRAPFRIVLGLANDEVGYIIPKAQWDTQAPFTFGAKKAWYGEVNSPGPDTAPVLLEALRKLAAHSSSATTR